MLVSLDKNDLEDFLGSRLQALIADANEAGFATQDVIAGLRHALEQQRLAYEADPDPADDPEQLEVRRAAKVRVPKDAFDDLERKGSPPRAG